MVDGDAVQAAEGVSDDATVPLFRPVGQGQAELELIAASGYRAFPRACPTSRSSTRC
jgi:hypothetical protein